MGRVLKQIVHGVTCYLEVQKTLIRDETEDLQMYNQCDEVGFSRLQAFQSTPCKHNIKYEVPV